MIKRLAAVFMALLYTVTVLGVDLNLHYCFDQVASVKIDAPVKRCTTAQAAKAMKCCKDKHVNVKVKDGHQSSSAFSMAKVFLADLPKASFYETTALANTYLTAPSYRGPPSYCRTLPSIYLSICNFRI